jgi:hypothetical protein
VYRKERETSKAKFAIKYLTLIRVPRFVPVIAVMDVTQG